MASVGTWRAPLPLKVGGGGHKAVTQCYDKINASIGTAIAHGAGSVQDIETRSSARAVALIHRATDRRYNQVDPTKLSTLLSTWEGLLGIVPGADDTEWTRRRRVASRLQRDNGAFPAGIMRLAEAAFAPWTVTMHYTAHGDAGVRLTWPGASIASTSPTTDTNFWTSSVGRFVIEYHRPANASDEDVNVRRAACLDALYEYASAWSTFNLSETPLYGPTSDLYGFYLDRPNIEKACFSGP